VNKSIIIIIKTYISILYVCNIRLGAILSFSVYVSYTIENIKKLKHEITGAGKVELDITHYNTIQYTFID